MSKPAKPHIDNENQLKNNGISLVIILITAIIPFAYAVVSNLPRNTPTPVILPAVTLVTQPVDQYAAIDSALQQANTNPSYNSYINLGMAYYNVGKFEESIKAWEKALEYNNQGDLAYNNIAAAYGSLQNYDAEIAICKRALSINPNFDLAKRNLKWATEMKNKQQK